MTHTRRWVGTLATAALAVTALAAPQQAMAVGGATLYVDNLSSACTDSGAGTQAVPFCTIQAAANSAVAGDTVLIYGSPGTSGFAGTPGDAYAGGITISHSGTASAPITFKAAQGSYEITGGSDGITVTGDYVEISGAEMWNQSLTSFWIGGAHDVIDSDRADTPGTPVYVNGGGTNLTVERSFLTTSGSGAVTFAGGGSGFVLTTNTITAARGNYAVLADSVSGLDITSNTISESSDCGIAVGVIFGSTDVTVENNLVSYGSCGSSTNSNYADLRVDSTSTASTTVGYNVFTGSGGGGLAPYNWAGTSYPTQAAFTAATGQGTGDIITSGVDLNTWSKPTSGPAAGSANASAPGELSTDIYGNAWSGTPNRGSVSYSDVTAATLYTSVPTVQQATALLDLQGIPWSGLPTYEVNWGDGGTAGAQEMTTVNQTTDFSDYLVFTHMYTRPGTYTVTMTVQDTAQTITRTANVTMTGSTYVPVSPTRVLDTRKGLGAAKAQVGPGKTLALSVTNGVTVPAGIGTISAVVMNVTVTNPTAGGNITVYPDGSTEPTTSNVNFSPAETVPNLVTVEVGANDEVELTNNSSGSTDLVADVAGY